MYKKNKTLIKLKRERNFKNRIIYNNAFYLDRNEKFIDIPSNSKKKLLSSLIKINPGFYPNIPQFYKKLSKFIRVSPNNLFITEGVSGGIKTIIEAYSQNKKSEILYFSPTFSMYEVYAKMFNLKEKKIKVTLDTTRNFNNLINKISYNTTFIFLPNPNIPIENFFDEKKICKLINICKKNKILLIVDEVYFPFSNFSVLKYLKLYNKLFILRSFSKAFGLAGIRLGYIISAKENIEYISKLRTGYETNSYSMAVADFYMNNDYILKNYITEVKKGFLYFKDKLIKNNISYQSGDQSCYIFVNLKNNKLHKNIINELKTKKIFIRSGWDKPYNNYVLISGTYYKKFIIFSDIFIKTYKKYNKNDK